MKIKQHIPSFCYGAEPLVVDFDNTEELLNIPFVRNFRMHPFDKSKENKYFKKYSLSLYAKGLIENDIYLLMIEYNPDGKWKESHLVIGYIAKFQDEKIDLPEWKFNEKELNNENHQTDG